MAIVKCFKSHLEIFTTGHKNYGLLIETGLGGKGGRRGLRMINLFFYSAIRGMSFRLPKLTRDVKKGRKKVRQDEKKMNHNEICLL